MHVVVVGAGITGLAAALTLADGGAEVTVLEAAPEVGGMLRTSAFAGRRVDEGADAFLIRTPAALDLATRAGLTDLVHPRAREARVWHDGALRPLPPHVMGVPLDVDAVAATGLLSPAGVDRLRADLTDPATPLPDGDVSVAEAIGGRLGPEALARLVDPLVAGINAGDTARQSLAAVVPQLDTARRDPGHASLIAACRAAASRARAATATGPGARPSASPSAPTAPVAGPAAPPDTPPVFAAPADGIDALPAAVAAAARATGRVTIRTGSGVAAVEPDGVVLDDGGRVASDGVVLAVPGHRAGPLVGAVDPEAGRLLDGIDHVSVAFVRLAVAPSQVDLPERASGVLVPRDAGMETTACSFASTKWTRLDPARGDGTLVLRAALGRDGGPDVTARGDLDIVATVVDDLRRVVGLRGDPVEWSVHRWRRAFPQYRPGHLDRVAAAEASLAERVPTVRLAGMYLRGVGIPASVASGRDAAAALLAAG